MINPTPEQNIAVDQRGLCVLSACPGSGKTFTVAHRIKRIVNEKRLSPYQGVVALSFTNIAKDSIIKEYWEISGKQIGSPHYVGTIDSFLNNAIFRPFSHKLIGNGKKEIRILDVHSDWLNIVYPELARFKINPQNITFNMSGEIVYQTRKMSDGKQQGYIEWFKKDLLKKCIVTQADVNFFCYEILKKYTNICRALIDKYPYFIIDEAQDCSAVQMGIVDLLVARGHAEVMLVGDAYQAIYEWRDADPLLFVKKETENNWQKKELLHSQRSGEVICQFLNKFHNNRAIKQDVAMVELNDAEVKVIHCVGRQVLCDNFLEDVKRKGIPIRKEKVAILYGGHASKINFRKTNIDPLNIWKNSDAGLTNTRKVYSLPLLSKIAFIEKNYKKSYSYIEKFFYYLIEEKHLASSDDIRGHLLDRIENRVVLWNLCTNLPSLETEIDDWICKTNALIFKTAQQLGMSSRIEIKKTKKVPNFNIYHKLFGTTEPFRSINNVTLENVHQIKGRTFDAVMVFIDSGSGNFKLSIGKLEKILQHKNLLTGNYHEDGRCFYVAASRARRLLWIASADTKIEKIFN